MLVAIQTTNGYDLGQYFINGMLQKVGKKRYLARERERKSTSAL